MRIASHTLGGKLPVSVPVCCAFLCALLLTAVPVLAEEIVVGSSANGLRVLSSNDSETILELAIGRFQRVPIDIEGETYYRLRLPEESITFERGAPELPRVVRSIIIPDGARMEVEVLQAEYSELRMPVAPSKGLMCYGEDPAAAEYEFLASYGEDRFYPPSVATLGSPYILRDFRAVTVTVFPFAYNPSSGTLRVCTHLELRLHSVGTSSCDPGMGVGENGNPKLRLRETVSADFLPIYARRFINFDHQRYEPIDEHGRLVVICHGDFLEAIQPYVDWKMQKGIATELWDVLAIGDTPEEIKDFVQAQYDSGGLTFVQLVGDETYVPTFITEDYYGWDIYGRSDSRYALLEGQDHYPEIFVGRFSCESVADLETQIDRTIHYERDLAEGEWLHRGAGLGTVWGEGYGYHGWNGVQSLEVIRGDLLGYHYTEVAQLYEEGEPPWNIVPVEAWEVTEVLHDGIGILNVDGNADIYYLDTGSYMISHVNALENDYELPFIFLAAPWCGNFSYDCFAEVWLRATNGATGAPTGAIAVYTSSNALQYAPPAAAMHETVDLLVGDEKNSFGGLMYNGACFMMDLYGAPDEYDTFGNLNILGDVALQVRTDTPEAMEIVHDPTIAEGQTQFLVSTGVAEALVCLSLEAQIVAADYADGEGNVTLIFDPFWEEVDVTLTVTAYNAITSVEIVPVTGGQGVGGADVILTDGVAPGYPNPAGGSVTVRFALEAGGEVRLEILNVSGERIRTLLAERRAHGVHRVAWDGRDELRRPVSSGTYFVRLCTERGSATEKMTLIR